MAGNHSFSSSPTFLHPEDDPYSYKFKFQHIAAACDCMQKRHLSLNAPMQLMPWPIAIGIPLATTVSTHNTNEEFDNPAHLQAMADGCKRLQGLRRCALKGGGGNNNQPVQWHCRMPSMVISALASWLLQSFLFCGCGWLSRLRHRVLQLCCGCCGCPIVVAVVPWLLHLRRSFPQLCHGCCSCAVLSCGCIVV